jgi:hypothetical protein
MFSHLLAYLGIHDFRSLRLDVGLRITGAILETCKKAKYRPQDNYLVGLDLTMS